MQNVNDDNDTEKFEVEPEIAELNKQFFVVGNDGGKCRVVHFEERYFEKDQTRLVMVLMSFEDFRNWLMNRLIQVGTTQDGKPIMQPLGKYWLSHPQRRQYDRIDFVPGVDLPPNVYNLWRGYNYEPKQGSWKLMKDHIKRILANNDEEAFLYIMRWVAWAVQNPADPAEVALVFRGGKGTGKGTLCRWVKNIFGQHGLQIFSSKHISGRFNGHLRDCVLLFADEAIAPNDKDSESILKGMLTEPMIPIEGKGRDIIQAPNHLHVVMASNSKWVIPATADERRFAVFDVSNEVAQRKDYFGPLHQEMENGGASAMLYDLLHMDLGDWHPRDGIPSNQALQDQRIQSLEGADSIWFDCLWNGDAEGDLDGAEVVISTKSFAKLARVTDRTAAAYLESMGCTKIPNRRPRSYRTPQLHSARKIWDKTRFQVLWDDTAGWFAAPPTPGKSPF